MDQTEEIEEIDGRGTLLQRRISTLVTILLVLAVLLCLYVAIQSMSNGFVNIGGFMMFRVVTGSMEPTIPVGALLVTKQADIPSSFRILNSSTGNSITSTSFVHSHPS